MMVELSILLRKVNSNLSRPYKNLIGERFGKLIVISEGEPIYEKSKNTKSGYHKRRSWNCLCDCRNYKYNANEHSLKSGFVKSFGCSQKEAGTLYGKQFQRKYNNYDLNNFFYGVGYDYKGSEFYFDKEDYEKIKNYCWVVKNDHYVESRDNDKKVYISLHRIIMDNPNGDVDHINHNPQDNRKSNLRVTTRSQNMANAKRRKDNTSGVKGVFYSNNAGRWYATIQINNKKYSKSFINKEDAVKYRYYLEDKYQKEYSYRNSMKESG